MITIRVTNAEQVVENQKGKLVALVGGVFTDLHEKVEEVVMDKIREALAAEGVEADIRRVPDGPA